MREMKKMAEDGKGREGEGGLRCVNGEMDRRAAWFNVIFSVFHDSFIQASKNFNDQMLAVFCRS